MRPKRPKTKMVRIRASDIEEMKKEARRLNKQLPDFQSELLKFYRRQRKK